MNRALVAAVSLALFGACKSAPKPFPEPQEVKAPPVRIDFQPPLGEDLVESTVTVRAEQPKGGQAAEERVAATLESRFERDRTGYVLHQRVTRVEVTRNGEKVDNPLVQLVTHFPIAVKLADDGAFVQLRNPEVVEEAVRETFPEEEEARAVLRYFTPEAVEAQAKEEWTSKYGPLFGREVTVGMAWYALETAGTSSGQALPYVVERKVTAIRQGEKGREVVLALGCPRDAAASADPEAMRAVLERMGEGTLEPTLTCSGEQVVAVAPFKPVSTTFELAASPTLETGAEVALVLKRNVRLVAPEGAEARADGP